MATMQKLKEKLKERAKEALFYKKIKEDIVQCLLCPHFCVIKDGERGKCGARENKKGRLYSLVYKRPCSIALDPIEKKPLFHFYPGSYSYSIATIGCTLKCLFCQNWQIAQARFEDVQSYETEPERIVNDALESNCKSISYTYTEPLVAFEYFIEIMKLAHKKGLKNIIVSNGFINAEPLKKWCKYIDAANIDLKGNDKFYNEICSGRISPVLEALKLYKECDVWLEVTNLIIPGYNDNEKEIKKLVEWVKENLGIDTPLHFSRFFPNYKMLDAEQTPQGILSKAKRIAENAGLKYIYIGNIYLDKAENTYCPRCKELLIERKGFDILQNRIKNGKNGRCFNCKERVAGVW